MRRRQKGIIVRVPTTTRSYEILFRDRCRRSSLCWSVEMQLAYAQISIPVRDTLLRSDR